MKDSLFGSDRLDMLYLVRETLKSHESSIYAESSQPPIIAKNL